MSERCSPASAMAVLLPLRHPSPLLLKRQLRLQNQPRRLQNQQLRHRLRPRRPQVMQSMLPCRCWENR